MLSFEGYMAVSCGQLKTRVDIYKPIVYLTSLLYFVCWMLTGTFISGVVDVGETDKEPSTRKLLPVVLCLQNTN